MSARMSAFNGLWKIKFTYSLSQDNHGENVSVQWLVNNRIHIQSKPEKPRRECQRSVVVKNRIHVQSKPGQPRRECQRSMACENSNPRTNWARTTMARTLAFNGSWKTEFTYILSQDNDGENVSTQWFVKIRIHVHPKPEQPRQKNVSVQWLVKNQIHIHPKPGQGWRECQRPMACEKSNPHTY